MQPMTGDATTALLRALRRPFAGLAPIVFEDIVSRSWASITFTGARHEVGFRLEGDGADAAASAFLTNLEAAEFRLPGHILADIALVSKERSIGPEGVPRVRIRLEALTVEDG